MQKAAILLITKFFYTAVGEFGRASWAQKNVIFSTVRLKLVVFEKIGNKRMV